jgi:hypothetical protein
VLLAYLASLLPALLVLNLASTDLAPHLDRSLFADRLLQGDSAPPVLDFLANQPRGEEAMHAIAAPRLLLTTLLQILIAAGLVEGLMERNVRHDRPFLAGIGRHGWRFVRSAAVFTCTAALLLGLLGVGISFATEGGDDRTEVLGWLVLALAGGLVYAVLDVAYDLSRIAAAAHGEGRMLVGFFRALGFTLRRPGVVLPLYGLFTLPMLALPAGYLALRQGWWITDGLTVAGLLVFQQALFVLRAFLQVGLWGAEIAYFQGLGEPRWCGRPDAQRNASSTVAERKQRSDKQ